MIFGKREKQIDMGTFASSKCSTCKKSYQYRFVKTTTYLVVFFVNLIPIRSEYEIVCDTCGACESTDSNAAKLIVRKEFAQRNFFLNLQTTLKIAFIAVVLAAAVIIPLSIKKPVDLQAYKDLVETDGIYSILNEDGSILASVDVENGKKTLSFYDAVSVLIGEPGADGTFYKHEYYQEVDDGSDTITLERIADEPGVLKDRYQSVIREYHYDAANDALGYATGIQNLSDIEYTPGKASYPYIYYLTDTDIGYYTTVIYIEDTARVRATFIPTISGEEPDQLISAEIETLDNGRTTTQSIYYLDDNNIALAADSGILPTSSADDMISFVEDNGLSATLVTEYTYYQDTKVVTAIDLSGQTDGGTMETMTQQFNVTEKDGYYILQAIA